MAVGNVGQDMTPYLDYHSQAFLLLHRRFDSELGKALIEQPKQLRRSFFLSKFEPNKIYEADSSWSAANQCLEQLEEQIKILLASRSVMFWNHIYRRIGVTLSSEHESITDPTTTALVRRIVDLAIQKYGQVGHSNELVPSDTISPNLILGGWMKRGFKSNMGAGWNKKWKAYTRILRNQRTWVAKDFGKKDLVSIYATEGFAYQYWLVTALLRSIGKGAIFHLDIHGDWKYNNSMDFHNLISSFDKRNQINSSFSSLSGLSFNQSKIAYKEMFEDYIAIPSYNVKRKSIDLGSTPNGGSYTQKFVPNFVIGNFSIKSFLDSHKSMNKAFKRANGFSLRSLLTIVSGLSSIVILPDAVLLSENEAGIQTNLSKAIQHMQSRAYGLLRVKFKELDKVILQRNKLLGLSEVNSEEMSAILSKIALKSEAQSKIGLWSGGPRYLLLPGNDLHMYDPSGIPLLLQTLFVSMEHDQSRRGVEFEETFRHDLKAAGFDVIAGVKRAPNGAERELDAAVQIGNTLIIFECFSMEKPLDFEIGKPKTIYKRTCGLRKKLSQVESAKMFFESHPIGKNYDFTQATEIVHVLVSPFVEWVWEAGPNLWIDQSTPRILSADEAIDFVIRIKSQ